MSKRSARTIAVLLFAFLANTSLYAQESTPDGSEAVLPACSVSRVGDREIKWFRHELALISICLPETLMKRKTERCRENCYIYESEELYFDLDPTYTAWRPSIEKRYPTFSVANKSIDGRPSNIWFFEDTGKYKYVSGVNVILERGQIGLGVYLFSKGPDPKPIAERMFSSIRFTTAKRE